MCFHNDIKEHKEKGSTVVTAIICQDCGEDLI